MWGNKRSHLKKWEVSRRDVPLCLTDSQTLRDRATQLLRSGSGALVTQSNALRCCFQPWTFRESEIIVSLLGSFGKCAFGQFLGSKQVEGACKVTPTPTFCWSYENFEIKSSTRAIFLTFFWNPHFAYSPVVLLGLLVSELFLYSLYDLCFLCGYFWSATSSFTL